jgi:hypothetical protein
LTSHTWFHCFTPPPHLNLSFVKFVPQFTVLRRKSSHRTEIKVAAATSRRCCNRVRVCFHRRLIVIWPEIVIVIVAVCQSNKDGAVFV